MIHSIIVTNYDQIVNQFNSQCMIWYIFRSNYLIKNYKLEGVQEGQENIYNITPNKLIYQNLS